MDWLTRPGVQVAMLMHRNVLLLLLVLQQLCQVALHGVQCRRRHRQTPQSGTVSLQRLGLGALLLPPWQCTMARTAQSL